MKEEAQEYMNKLIPNKIYDNSLSISITYKGILFGSTVFLKDIQENPSCLEEIYKGIVRKLDELKIINESNKS